MGVIGLFSLAAAWIAGEKKQNSLNPLLRFDDVYAEHFSFVWRSLRGLGVLESAIDDTAQEVFVIVYRKLDTVTDADGIKRWLFSIVRRVASEHRRSRRRKGIAVEYDDSVSTAQSDTPQKQVEHRQVLEAIESFMNELSEENRSIFVLSEIEQLPVARISEILEMNPNTIYSRLKVIRSELEGFMAKRKMD